MGAPDRVHVFPIKDGDIPASYVSETQRVQPSKTFRNPNLNKPVKKKKNILFVRHFQLDLEKKFLKTSQSRANLSIRREIHQFFPRFFRVTLFGGFKWPFQGLSDLHLGDQRVTWKKLAHRF